MWKLVYWAERKNNVFTYELTNQLERPQRIAILDVRHT